MEQKTDISHSSTRKEVTYCNDDYSEGHPRNGGKELNSNTGGARLGRRRVGAGRPRDRHPPRQDESGRAGKKDRRPHGRRLCQVRSLGARKDVALNHNVRHVDFAVRTACLGQTAPAIGA